MIKNVFFLLILIVSSSVFGQILEPVKWTTSVKKISATEYDLVATAKIDMGWHLYSQSVPEGGPIATTFLFKKTDNFLLVGKTLEEKGHTIEDPVFKMKIKYFEKLAKFTQRIKLKKAGKAKIIAEVEFMVCDDTRCLPPQYLDLEFNIQ